MTMRAHFVLDARLVVINQVAESGNGRSNGAFLQPPPPGRLPPQTGRHAPIHHRHRIVYQPVHPRLLAADTGLHGDLRQQTQIVGGLVKIGGCASMGARGNRCHRKHDR